MKKAIVIHGNLRTFLMPLREYPSLRICDVAMDRIILPNIDDADVFIHTDCNDFFYNGAQYFCDDKKIEINNSDSFRLYPHIRFESKDVCREIITKELKKIIPNIKNLVIEDPFDCFQDKKYKLLNEARNIGLEGCSPSSLIGQYKKLKHLYQAIERQEEVGGFKYDSILKIRFDALYPQANRMYMKNYPLTNDVVYVPGSNSKFIYDWFAFGSREVMKHYLCLYDNLGFTISSPSWLLEFCPLCGKKGIDGTIENSQKGWRDSCPICKTNAKIWVADVTLSSEYHLWKMYSNLGIKAIGLPESYPIIYRYLDLGTNITLDQILSQLDNSGVKLLNHHMSETKIKTL